MTDLRERLLSAESAGGLGVSGVGVAEQVVPAVRRRKAWRAGAVGAVVVVTAIVLTAATVSVVSSLKPIEPTVTPSTQNAEKVSTASVGETPGATPTEAMWSEIDDRWVLALWATGRGAATSTAASDMSLIVVAPDGRTWKVADVSTSGGSEVVAWDPVARTALLATRPDRLTPMTKIADLGIVSLDGGEDSWTSECLDTQFFFHASAEQIAAPRVAAAYDGGYAVRNICSGDFLLRPDGVRNSLDPAGEAVLAEAAYPRTGITDVVYNAHGATVGNTDVYFDPTNCSLLVRPRAVAMGLGGLDVGCEMPGAFTLDDSEQVVTLGRLPGYEGSPFIYFLCGTSAVFGSLSDARFGVGVIDGAYAKSLVLGGSPASSCVDGRLTWYLAGGDLYSAATDDDIVRLVGLIDGESDAAAGAGVLSVAPAPAP